MEKVKYNRNWSKHLPLRFEATDWTAVCTRILCLISIKDLEMLETGRSVRHSHQQDGRGEGDTYGSQLTAVCVPSTADKNQSGSCEMMI